MERNQKIIKAIKKQTLKHLKSRKKARQYLIGLGIYDIDGNLRKEYGGEA